MAKKLLFILLISSGCLCAQEDLLGELYLGENQQTKITSSFNGTRLINFHTTELQQKGSVEFRVAHRFADVSRGFENFFGLDGSASIQLSFDFALKDNLSLGIGRTNQNRLINGFVKYRVLQQEKSNKKRLISVVLLTQMNLTHRKPNYLNEFRYFSNRLSYFNQVIISRKFNDRLSLFASPTYARQNLVSQNSDNPNLFSVASGARIKLSKMASITMEHSARINEYSADFKAFRNSFSIGLDLETGGHVFQIFFTNSNPTNEIQVISMTDSDWLKNQFRLGFNVSRVF